MIPESKPEDLPDLTGKDVIIVGNATSLFEKDHTAQINYHDIVVRINMGVNLNHKQIDKVGTRCDIHTGGAQWLNLDCSSVETPKWQVYMSPKFRDSYSYPNCLYYPLDWWSALQASLEGATPSSGSMTTDMCLRLGGNVSVIGFDWYATPNFAGMPEFNLHNFQREEEWIRGQDVNIIT